MLNKKRLLTMLAILVAVLAIQLKGLSINKVREKFRCALNRRRVTLSMPTSRRDATTVNLTSTTTGVPTTTAVLYILSQSCNGGIQAPNLYPAFTIQCKF
jgi:hypothetical protein